MNTSRNRNCRLVDNFVLATVAALALCIPAAGASSLPGDQVPGLTAAPVLNITNASLENTTILLKYQVTPAPMKIAVGYEETLAGAKGEMAAGPRTIGFTFPPVTLVVVLAAAVAVIAGAGWLVWRKRNEEDKGQ